MFFLRPLFAVALLSATLTARTQSARQLPAELRPYTACKLPGGPDVVEVTPLPAVPMVRTVQTLRGPANIRMLDGVRVMFAYPESDFFANLKAEELPAETYTSQKADLISDFDKTLASDNAAGRNYTLKPTLNGFEIYGLDRTKLEGGVLGIYLFFDDSTHVVTTIYFLNQEPAHRHFSSLAEYARLRDSFLQSFTTCIRSTATPSAPAH